MYHSTPQVLETCFLDRAGSTHCTARGVYCWLCAPSHALSPHMINADLAVLLTYALMVVRWGASDLMTGPLVNVQGCPNVMHCPG